MPFEDDIANLNQAYFFREFTYSSSTFRYRTEDNVENEVELADSLLWLGNNLIVYQLKERTAPNPTTPDQEKNWYERKVLGKGTKQVRDTLGYLQDHAPITVRNHRGHNFDLSNDTIDNIHKLIVFKPAPELPVHLKNKKFYVSSTAGIIHLIHADDYIGLIRTFLTPAEFMDYLAYREELIQAWGDHVNNLPEQALAGHYIAGNVEERPEFSHAEILENVNHRIEQWDISGIVTLFADRIVWAENATDYYTVVTALAQLRRHELEQFKQRYVLSIENARTNQSVKPYRMAIPRLDIGFVFIPITEEEIPERNIILQSHTELNKYDQGLSKCLGILFARDGHEHYLVDWCFMDFPWATDEEFERFLAENNPFRDVRVVDAERYQIDEDEGVEGRN